MSCFTGTLTKIMKTFEAIAAKKVVATFKIEGDLFRMLGNCWTNPAVDMFFTKHPEYKDLPLDHTWVVNNTEEYVLYTIYSVGQIVINEIH